MPAYGRPEGTIRNASGFLCPYASRSHTVPDQKEMVLEIEARKATLCFISESPRTDIVSVRKRLGLSEPICRQ